MWPSQKQQKEKNIGAGSRACSVKTGKRLKSKTPERGLGQSCCFGARQKSGRRTGTVKRRRKEDETKALRERLLRKGRGGGRKTQVKSHRRPTGDLHVGGEDKRPPGGSTNGGWSAMKKRKGRTEKKIFKLAPWCLLLLEFQNLGKVKNHKKPENARRQSLD